MAGTDAVRVMGLGHGNERHGTGLAAGLAGGGGDLRLHGLEVARHINRTHASTSFQ